MVRVKQIARKSVAGYAHYLKVKKDSLTLVKPVVEDNPALEENPAPKESKEIDKGEGPPAILRSRATCRWQPPGEGWLKLNFDGATRCNLGKAGIGCVVHNWEGKEVAFLSSPASINTNNWAELLALVEGLLLCRKHEAKYLDIEGDSTIVVNALRKGSMPDWKLNTLLSKAMDICKGFDRFTDNHIYREGNKRADELANMGSDGIKLLSLPT
ncbi:uncharacterized protein LOC131042915 [Cryptomeria japonica]|uniref:uncharacterized protein LOC131042915 n=1 Tax=Cryptomeria japonica TaxID=3369 RepID=UPI0025ABA531|nr:uncharacterized protein LOC131042915 [Cryptomeria japonica]